MSGIGRGRRSLPISTRTRAGAAQDALRVPHFRCYLRRSSAMSNETKELIELCEQLPAHKRMEVTDFARFLLSREGGPAVGTNHRGTDTAGETTGFSP